MSITIAAIGFKIKRKNEKAKSDTVTPDCRHKCNACGINAHDIGRGMC